jgi:solute carrier family 45 protein 1/2/4
MGVGFLVQPLVGVYSDGNTSRFGRRRPYILGASVLVLLALHIVAYAYDMAWWAVTTFQWSMEGKDHGTLVKEVAIILAVIGFYMLDFSINVVQACCRALVLDVSPGHQQARSNAWASMMMGLGAVLGYTTGFLDLVYLLPEFGDTQLQVLCRVAVLFYTTTIVWTVVWTREQQHTPLHDDHEPSRWWHVGLRAFQTIQRLPPYVRRICYTQFFAWIAWFPFLFYSTAYIREVLLRDHLPNEPGFPDAANRTGSLALLLNALVMLLFSILGPQFHHASRYFVSFPRILQVFSVPAIWTYSHLVLAALLLSTLLVKDVNHAMLLLALMGIPFAVALWAPFAMIGQECARILAIRNRDGLHHSIQEDDDSVEDDGQTIYSSVGGSRPASLHTNASRYAIDGGTVLGLHNVFIVLPQFVSVLLSTLVFSTDLIEPIGVVLRIGAGSALFAALLSLRLWKH